MPISLKLVVWVFLVFSLAIAQDVPFTASAPRAGRRSFRGRRSADLVNNPFAHLQVNASALRDKTRLGFDKRDASCAVAQPSSICTCTNGGTPTTPMFCSGLCVDTSSDPNNCGSCGAVCYGTDDLAAAVAAQTCQGGQCGCYSSSYSTPCGQGTGQYCTNVASSDQNCGTCGITCVGVATCEVGSCACRGMIDTLCGNACYNLHADPMHCGSCTTVCGSGYDCSNGVCCASGLTGCGGQCSDFTSDPSNCGSCSTSCPSGDICSASICCASGTTNCGGLCVSTGSDNNNCGTCGTICEPDFTCDGGSCVCSGTGNEICNGVCINVLGTDDHNCGGCGQSCPEGASCDGGECACPSGLQVCSDVCLDPSDYDGDNSNCGSCGNICSPYATCKGGGCVCNAGYTPCLSGCAVEGACGYYGNVGVAYSSSQSDVTCYLGIDLSTTDMDCASGGSTTPIAIGNVGVGPQNLPYYLIINAQSYPNTLLAASETSTLPTTSNGGYGYLVISDPTLTGPGQGPSSGAAYGIYYYESDVWTISGTFITLSSGQRGYPMSMVWDVTNDEPYSTTFVYSSGYVYWYLTEGGVPPDLVALPSVVLYFIPSGIAPPGCGPPSDPGCN